jgi:hypothetical protein
MGRGMREIKPRHTSTSHHQKLAFNTLNNRTREDRYEQHTSPPLIITPLVQGKTCQEDLRLHILQSLHWQKLQLKLMKDNQWEIGTFHKVDWNAFKKAIYSLPRSHRISITKLLHQLWHTNQQDMKYYGKAATCPLGAIKPTNRFTTYMRARPQQGQTSGVQLYSALESVLEKISSSALVKQTILTNIHGTNPEPATCLDPTLQQAIAEQNEIGWEALLRGHISKQWGEIQERNPKKQIKDRKE